ncbi:MAG TPA: M14 family metallopeptidase [Candidatus Paceibacterota bacterium]|nr:M14 family metallopeptidase [Candidatus Paceibacterota bacterium]
MKKSLIAVIVIILVIILGAGVYFWMQQSSNTANVTPPDTTGTTPDTTQATTTAEGASVVIGKSAGGNDITAYNYGTGDTRILFVGGIHGGYEWNTSLVAYQLMDYLEAHPDAIAKNETVTVIPVVNPDGLKKVVGTAGPFTAADVTVSSAATVPGRFNANTVDLNRNFDCDWQAEGTWQNTKVSGGTSAFSEPESQAIKAYVESHDPAAVIVWYSSAGGVYASSCHNGVSAATAALTKTFADASGYPAHQTFDFYEITGDMVNWLAKNQIPAISVLLTNHTDTEWTKNWKGIAAVLNAYAE